MTSILYDISRTGNRNWRPFGLAALLSGLALISFLLSAKPGETQQPALQETPVRIAIVTCQCSDAEQPCRPLLVDSSVQSAREAPECEPNTGTTCAQCLETVAATIQTTLAPPPFIDTLIDIKPGPSDNAVTIWLLAGSANFAAGPLTNPANPPTPTPRTPD